ncbi:MULTISPECIES: DUF5675 family protein [unclassified Rhizobium]|uniref:DUF5675 family protein n=1 Tax=unclassified Rhizobium TaxID=2613769 RepID=UPI001B33E5B0|nr:MULTISPECIES: DUF5675 family protein [unclassified Rhizobium]MBX5256875.1 hypothetical protein [Rhizobium sp. NLR16b]MBX5262967.1 hypothetical protein [Rhizobium sp. NLR16a]MBX5311532.1 hypothetical protein [Rhizobium sp. NLR11b]QTU95930.1 hypothetical protein J7U39_15995 [Rhizobium sp. NLR16a]
MSILYTRRTIGRAACASMLAALVKEIAYAADDTLSLRLIRTYETNVGITGELLCNGRFVAHTLERPWSLQSDVITSIPEGQYRVFLHYKEPDKQHKASGIYWRMELNWTDTKPRTAVQIHIGNTIDQTIGCILPGLTAINKELRLVDSAGAVSALEEQFYGSANPVSTPDKSIVLNISSLPKPTELMVTDDAGRTVLRQDGLKWFLIVNGQGTHMYDEIKRTTRHFVFTGAPGTFAFGRQVRIGLHGGIIEISKDGKQWRRFNPGSTVQRSDEVMKYLAPL